MRRQNSNDRMGHEDGLVQARYSHITAGMPRTLLDGLTRLWESALDECRAMADGSPVAALDRLLRKEEENRTRKIFSQISPNRACEKRKARLSVLENRA